MNLKLGVFIGPGNPQGRPIALAQAEEHVFGICLLNDWSARDIQFWEMAPLDPQPLDYLEEKSNREQGVLDIQLSVCLETQRAQVDRIPPAQLSRTSFRHQYWTVAAGGAAHRGGLQPAAGRQRANHVSHERAKISPWMPEPRRAS